MVNTLAKYLPNSRITVIIPFLNEGVEVYNTVKSIRNTSNVEILLINDASTDNYNYENISAIFNTQYIYHSERRGVAASRDEGVKLCKTDYFLLLDAHMRFYQNDWDKEIVKILDLDDRVILCCQTKVLSKINGEIIESRYTQSYGAKTEFDVKNNILSTSWIYHEKEPESVIEDVPCVLGGAYATSKKYWEHLAGLSGLKSYGNDEAYISIKAWLEGGRCKLLKDITVGHIYRKESPYEQISSDLIYNKMLISETLLPSHMNRRVFYRLKMDLPCSVYKDAYILFLENIDNIQKLKIEYSNFIKKDFSFIYELNSTTSDKGCDLNLIDTIGRNIIFRIGLTSHIGLFYGRMGGILFLYHYASKFNNGIYNEIAGELLNELFNSVGENMPINFSNGLCGIAWGIQYIMEAGFIEGDIDEILEDIDRKIMEWDPSRMSNFSFSYGLGGILFYVLGRLMTSHNTVLFDTKYLTNLMEGAKNILTYEQSDSASIEAALRYSFYYKNNGKYNYSLSLYDLLDEIPFEESKINTYPLGFKNGLAGIGLKLILE